MDTSKTKNRTEEEKGKHCCEKDSVGVNLNMSETQEAFMGSDFKNEIVPPRGCRVTSDGLFLCVATQFLKKDGVTVGKANEIFIGPDLFGSLCAQSLSVGDTLFLREWIGGSEFTGREMRLEVIYMTPSQR